MRQDLTSALRDHIDHVDRRTTQGSCDDAQQARLAADTAAGLLPILNLRDFRGRLNTSSGKPQVLLAFHSPSHGDVVLKVYGRIRPHEAEVQRLWHAAGVATVGVIASGNRPTSWILMPRVGGTAPTSEQAKGLTSIVSSIAAQAHRIHRPGIRHGQSLHNGIAHHLATALSATAQHGYPIPHGWEDAASAAYGSGRRITLHGDLTVKNMMRDGRGRLLLLDACGYLGPAEFDAARWSARAGGAEHARSILASWLQHEPDLDAELATRLLGLELLMEAGVRELVKEECSVDCSERDEETLRCLQLGTRLLAE